MASYLLLSCVLALLVAPKAVLGEIVRPAPANPLGWEELHPDGESTHRLFFRGEPSHGEIQIVDELGHVMEGDPSTGLHRRRELSNVNATDMESSISPDSTVHDIGCKEDWCPDGDGLESTIMFRKGGTRSMQTSGVYRLLVLLVRFEDHNNRQMPSLSDMQTLFNSGGDEDLTPTGSVRDFFLSQSFNKLNVVATLRNWVTIPGTEAFHARNVHGMTSDFGAGVTRSVLETMDAEGFQWNEFDRDGDGVLDGVLILHSGFAAEASGKPDCISGKPWGPHRIWSHQTVIGQGQGWQSNDQKYRIGRYATSSAIFGDCGTRCARVGVVGHEVTHLLSVPDMIGGSGLGVGFYDVMGNSWGPDGTQFYPGTMSPWVREQLDWLEPTRLTQPGVYELRAAQDTPDVYKIDVGFPEGEFLLVENRQKKKYDAAMLDGEGGILVWHVAIPPEGSPNKWQSAPGWPGQGGWPANGKHYQVALLTPDGEYDLEQGNNLGDHYDFWRDGMILGPGPATNNANQRWIYPNTDCYMKGQIRKSGVTLSEFSKSGDVMSFRLSINGPEVKPVAKISFGSSSFTEGYDPPQSFRVFGNPSYYKGDGKSIRGTASDNAYNSHAWSKSDFGYILDLEPNRSYDVTLGFAESFEKNCQRHRRVFSAQVGNKRVDDIDVALQVGCNAVYTVRFPEVMSSGSGDLVVHLSTQYEDKYPFLSTLEVIETPGAQAAIQASTDSQDLSVPFMKIQFGSGSRVDDYEPANPSDIVTPVRNYSPNVNIKGKNAGRQYAGHAFAQEFILYKLQLDGNSRYDVKLGFAESFAGNCVEGKRVFTATVGTKSLTNIDVYDAVGCMTAYDVMFKDVRPDSSGRLLVALSEQRENPFLSLLEVSISPRPFIKIHFGSSRVEGEYNVPEPWRMIGSYNFYSGKGEKIIGTADPEAYSGHVWSEVQVGYRLSLDPAQRYDIVLGFAETFTPNCSNGKRIFSVTVGSQSMTDIDVFAAAGCRNPHDIKFRGVSPSSSGELVVLVQKGRKENPFLSVLEVSVSQ